MDAKVRGYLSYIFRSFQGFRTKDIKEYRSEQRMELILENDYWQRQSAAPESLEESWLKQ